MTLRFRLRALVVLALCVGGLAVAPSASQAHLIWTCPNYAHLGPYNYTWTDCVADPFTAPATHQWLAQQATVILRGDGFERYANLLSSTIRVGSDGVGRTHLDLLIEGEIRADTYLNGCTDYGSKNGWPIGDHMLNPYRGFGVWSYSQHEALGWQ